MRQTKKCMDLSDTAIRGPMQTSLLPSLDLRSLLSLRATSRQGVLDLKCFVVSMFTKQ